MSPSGSPSPASVPLYQTELAQTPLPEILATVHRYKVPGTIECRRGDVVKRIFVERGRIIFATTSLIAESLGDMLLRDGRITRAQYDESVRRHKETGKRHGVTMVEMKIIDPQELFVAVRAHIMEIIWSIFSWDAGQVTFTPGRHDKGLEFVRVDISIPDALLGGVLRMPDVRALVAKLGTKTTLFDRTDKDAGELTLSDAEAQLLAAVDGRHTLFELTNLAPLPAATNARLLYGFHVLGLIAVTEPRQIKVQIRR